MRFRGEHLLGFSPNLPSLAGHIFQRENLTFHVSLTLQYFPLFWDLSVGLMWIFHFVWCVSIYKLCFSHLLCFTLSLFPLKIKKMTVKSLFHVLRWPQFFRFCSLEAVPHPQLLIFVFFFFPISVFGHSDSLNLCLFWRLVLSLLF